MTTYKDWMVLSCHKHGASDGALHDLMGAFDLLIPIDVSSDTEVDDDGSIMIRWWVDSRHLSGRIVRTRIISIALSGDGNAVGVPSELGSVLPEPWACSLRDKSVLEWRLLCERRPIWEAK